MKNPLSSAAKIIRLTLAIVFIGISTLCIVQTSWIPLWILSIGATEYGHWFAICTMMLVFSVSPKNFTGAATVCIAMIATVIFLSPIFRAIPLAMGLHGQLKAAFGNTGEVINPISWTRLFLGVSAKPVPVESLAFSEHDGKKLTLRFYRAVSQKPAPCVVVVHTGGWNNGTTDEFLPFNFHLVQSGYATACIEYRLAPRWQWPAQREDALDAIRFLKTHAESLGIDPQKFVLLGRSAGGQIAEAVAYGAHDIAIRGCIAFYAPADMNFAYKYSREDDILKSPQLLRDFLGGTPAQVPKNYKSASPILLAGKDSPPTLLFHGAQDPLVWFLQSKRLAMKLESTGVRHLFVRLDWATHAFDYNFSGPGGQISTCAVDYFLAAVTK